jgi:hypothetical protein
MVSLNIDKYLTKLYYTPEFPGSFSSADKLWRHVKTRRDTPRGLTRSVISKWLIKQDVHTIHKQPSQKFMREKIIVGGIGEMGESDLLDLSMLKKDNNNNSFVLVCIDAFSKYIWLRPLKNKSGIEVKNAFEDIFTSVKPPARCHTDKGGEYSNQIVKTYLKTKDVHLYFSESDKKCPIVERVILEIKRRLFKIFYHNQSYKYLDILQKIASSINSTYNRSIGMAPKDVNLDNELEIYTKNYLPFVNEAAHLSEKGLSDSVLKPGTPVRISYKRGKFSRGYNESFSEEIFIIKSVIRSTPQRYILEDLHGNAVSSSFYKEELSETNISADKVYKIDKVLKFRRLKGRKREALVSWYGWPSPLFDSWIPAASLKNV